MSFICENCNEIQNDGIKPRRVVTQLKAEKHVPQFPRRWPEISPLSTQVIQTKSNKTSRKNRNIQKEENWCEICFHSYPDVFFFETSTSVNELED